MATKGELRQRILSFLEAEYDEEHNAKTEEWLLLGLEDCYQQLRPWWMIREARITIQARARDAIDVSRAQLPPSFLGMVAMIPWEGGRALEPVSPEQLAAWLNRYGGPAGYMMAGSYVTVLPLQTQEASYRATYWSRFEPLLEDGDQNMLTVRAWNAVVYAALRHAAVWREDEAALGRYESAFGAMVEIINRDSYTARFGSGMVMRRA